jgi:hypothetical protein
MESQLRRLAVLFGLIVFVPASALAQTNAAALAGCYRFEANPETPESILLQSGQDVVHEIQFVQPADRGRVLILDKPQASDMSHWEVASSDSLLVSIGYGFSGIIMELELTEGLLQGTAAEWTDGMDPIEGVRQVPVTGTPISCPTP